MGHFQEETAGRGPAGALPGSEEVALRPRCRGGARRTSDGPGSRAPAQAALVLPREYIYFWVSRCSTSCSCLSSRCFNPWLWNLQ